MKQSQSIRRVVRKYNTKKGAVIKTYEYKTSTLRSRKKYLISSTGRVSKASIKRLVNKGVASEMEIKAEIADYQFRGMTRVSEERVEASITHNRIEGMFANAGMSIDEAANEIGVSVEDLYNIALWNDDIYTSPDGTQWRFIFNYTGDVFERVTA